MISNGFNYRIKYQYNYLATNVKQLAFIAFKVLLLQLYTR